MSDILHSITGEDLLLGRRLHRAIIQLHVSQIARCVLLLGCERLTSTFESDGCRQTDRHRHAHSLRHGNTHMLGRDRMGYEKDVLSFELQTHFTPSHVIVKIRDRKRYGREVKMKEHAATHNVHRGSRHGWETSGWAG
jgi:hypothetical protein